MWYLIVLITVNSIIMGNPIRKHAWKERVLIVTASSPTNVGYKRQNQLLEKGKKGMKERNLVIYRLYSDHWMSPSQESLTREETTTIQEAYHIEPDTFSVVLIGKDGGVKLRSNELVSTKELFQLIDSMPMRQQEVRKQKESGY